MSCSEQSNPSARLTNRHTPPAVRWFQLTGTPASLSGPSPQRIEANNHA